MDLSPNSLAHSALALHHSLRGPASMASLTHGSPLDHINSSSSGRTSPCPSGLNYGATLAHFMSMPSGLNQRGLPPHLQHLQHHTTSSTKSEKALNSPAGKSLPSISQNSNLPNGLTHSPTEDSSTPTPGQGELLFLLTVQELRQSSLTSSFCFIRNSSAGCLFTPGSQCLRTGGFDSGP